MARPNDTTLAIGRPVSAAVRRSGRRARLRGTRNAVIALGLSAMIIVSLFVVPAAGAGAPNAGPPAVPPGIDAATSGGAGPTVEGAGAGSAGPAGPRHDSVSAGWHADKDEDKEKDEDEDENEGKENGKAKGHDKDKDEGEGRNGGGNGKSSENRGGPTVSVSVSPSNDAPGRAYGPGPSDRDVADHRRAERGETSTVDVAVGGVAAGDTVSMHVKTNETEDDDAAFDSITLGVEKPGNFSMRIIATRDPLPGSPAFDTDDGAQPLQRIRLEHSISNDDVDDVAFTFRVSKARLRATGTDIERVALYRHADGAWTALPTEVVGETPTHYVFTADSPGMSEFTVGAMRPEFDLWYAGVDATTVDEGEPVVVRGRITNVGSAAGVFTAELVVDGRVVDSQRVTVASGGTRQTTFAWTFDRPGDHEVRLNDVPAGVVTVRAAETTEAPAAEPERGSLFGWLAEMSVGSMLEWAAGSSRVATTGVAPVPVAAWLA